MNMSSLYDIFTTKKMHAIPKKTVRIPIKPRKTGYRSPTTGAQTVSFTTSDDSLSPLYDRTSDMSYLAQCFLIMNCIGEGSFGLVFKAQSIEDGRNYAIKKSRERFRNSSDRKRKLTEVEKFERLSKHPNCVRLYKAWEEDGYLYMQMELCEYSLSWYTISHHDIPEEMVWNILTDISLALKHLHDKNIMHMDVKLDNILVAANGYFKLGDFGIAIDCTQITRDIIDGDPKYMAPELMNDFISKPADIFSLGISLLELIYDLNLPQKGALWHRLRQGVLPYFDTHVSYQLLNLVQQMMHPFPDKRPTVDMILREPTVKKILRKRLARRIYHYVVSSGELIIDLLQYVRRMGLQWCRNIIQKIWIKRNELDPVDEFRSIDESEDPMYDEFITSTPISKMTMEESDTPSRSNESWELSEYDASCEYEASNSPSPVGESPELPLRIRIKKRRNLSYRAKLSCKNMVYLKVNDNQQSKCEACNRLRRGIARNLSKEFNTFDSDFKED